VFIDYSGSEMTNPSKLDGRYGRQAHTTGSRRRNIILASVAGLAIVLGWFIWANPVHIGGVASGEVTSQTIVDEHHVSLTFTVTAEANRTVACALKAQDLGFNIVGWKVVEFPASDQPNRSFTSQVITIRRAVNGLVADCWLT
jgi:hypothetical protein